MVNVVLNDCSKEELMKLGEEIRKMRKNEGVSQQVLADIMLKDRSTISKLESGQSTPNVQILTEIANELGYKFSIRFEKVSEEDLSNSISLSSENIDTEEDLSNSISLSSENIDTEKRKSLYRLKEHLRAYCDILETQYLEECDDYDEEDKYYAKYHKNKLNYRLSINNSNMEDVKDGLVIYVDNPDVCFLDVSAEWDRSIYMSITPIVAHHMSLTSTGTRMIYNIDLVKENFASGSKKLLFTCREDNPINVIIAAENIKKAYLENMDLNTIDVGNKKLLKVPTEKLKTKCIERRDVCEYDIKACVDFEKVVHQFEGYNSYSDSEENTIKYKLSIIECNSVAATSCHIDYRGSKWSCLVKSACTIDESNHYTLSKMNKSNRSMSLEVINAGEVLDAILKYS